MPHTLARRRSGLLSGPGPLYTPGYTVIATNLARPGLILLGSLIVPEAGEETPGGGLTFNRDIAPIIFQHCSPCHRPGGAGPFDLLSYADVKKRGNFLVAVTQSRYMPPWQPEPGFAEFIGQRRLTDKQIGMLRQWVAEAPVEGDPSHLPPVPDWPTGWFLGKPDLEVVMPRRAADHPVAGGEDEQVADPVARQLEPGHGRLARVNLCDAVEGGDPVGDDFTV